MSVNLGYFQLKHRLQNLPGYPFSSIRSVSPPYGRNLRHSRSRHTHAGTAFTQHHTEYYIHTHAIYTYAYMRHGIRSEYTRTREPDAQRDRAPRRAARDSPAHISLPGRSVSIKRRRHLEFSYHLYTVTRLFRRLSQPVGILVSKRTEHLLKNWKQ